MEPWLLNWTSFVLSNTHAKIDGLKYKDGSQWIQKTFELWTKNSDYGQMVYDKTYGLTISQVKKLDEWKSHIKAIYGEYGDYSFTFTPTGIGTGVEVYSELANVSLDLTEIENW